LFESQSPRHILPRQRTAGDALAHLPMLPICYGRDTNGVRGITGWRFTFRVYRTPVGLKKAQQPLLYRTLSWIIADNPRGSG